jgi:3-phosphoshikimate 1-carboxyvinyltransferase
MPGDKSISHRAAIIAAMARGRTRINNFSTSEDCSSTLSCLKALGVVIERQGTQVTIDGVGRAGFRDPRKALDCGNSGSTMRMLAGVLASQNFVSELTGDAALCSRPMNRIIEPLTMMGASIESTDGHAPLRINGSAALKPISYVMPVASAQVKTCILLAGLCARGRTEVIEGWNSTRDHTERMLKWFGVPVLHNEVRHKNPHLGSIAVTGNANLKARNGVVPGDMSSAAFFVAAAAALPGSALTIHDVGLNPTRATLIDTLCELGVDALSIPNFYRLTSVDFNEPFGDIEVTGTPRFVPSQTGRSNVISGKLIPRLIDELPMLAVFGTQLRGGLRIRDAGELRVKESDRIAAIVKNLHAMGAEVEEHDDGMTVKGRVKLSGAKLNSFGDHRIAMAFSIAALIADGESEITGAECVSVSCPEFYELLESVVKR